MPQKYSFMLWFTQMSILQMIEIFHVTKFEHVENVTRKPSSGKWQVKSSKNAALSRIQNLTEEWIKTTLSSETFSAWLIVPVELYQTFHQTQSLLNRPGNSKLSGKHTDRGGGGANTCQIPCRCVVDLYRPFIY